MGRTSREIKMACQIQELDNLVGGLGNEVEDLQGEVGTINKKLDALRDMFTGVMKALKPKGICDCPDCQPAQGTAGGLSDTIAAREAEISILKERLSETMDENYILDDQIVQLKERIEALTPPVMPKRTRRSPAEIQAEKDAKASLAAAVPPPSDKIEVVPEPEVKVQTTAAEPVTKVTKMKLGKAAPPANVIDPNDEL